MSPRLIVGRLSASFRSSVDRARCVAVNRLPSYALPLLFFLIWFQQFPVVKSGGNLKLYELAGVLVLAVWLFLEVRKRVYGVASLLLFVFFLVIPAISLLLHLESLDYALEYYRRFPEVSGSLRFNVTTAPLLVFLYYGFCWAVWNTVAGSARLGAEPNTAVRFFIAGGLLSGLYVLYGLVAIRGLGLPDLLPSFLDGRNSRPEFQARPSGFTAEPGIFVLTLTWISLFVFFLRDLFRDPYRRVLVLAFFVVLLGLTMSSSILAPVFAVCIWGVVFGSRSVRRGMLLALVAAVILMLLLRVGAPEFAKSTYYIFVTKIRNFVVGEPNTLDSGGMRRFTSLLGLETWKSAPWFGVGPGCSLFHMFRYEYSVGIKFWGERLSASVPVQNCHAMILAESGVFGYLAFTAAWIAYFFEIRPLRRLRPDWHAVAFIGGISTWLMMFAVIPTHGLYLWLCPALCLAAARGCAAGAAQDKMNP